MGGRGRVSFCLVFHDSSYDNTIPTNLTHSLPMCTVLCKLVGTLKVLASSTCSN